MLTGLKYALQRDGTITSRHKAWRRVVSDRVLAVAARPMFDADTEIFVIGSCFANEIRAVLDEAGLVVHPRIDPEIAALLPDELKIDPSWGGWDERVHYQCYTPFSIRQEIAWALGEWTPAEGALFEGTREGRTAYWDPYRRAIFAFDPDRVLQVRDRMSQRIRDGIERADLVVMTLGLIEAFRLRDHDGYAAEFSSFYRDRLVYWGADYASAERAVMEACDMILAAYPGKRIVVTVSPIPLGRTHSDTEIITATTRGKSILRAVADTVSSRYESVHYWPSYEFVMWSGDGFRRDDLRHVEPAVVHEITNAFCECYFSADVARLVAARPVRADTAAGRAPDRAAPGLLGRLIGRVA